MFSSDSGRRRASRLHLDTGTGRRPTGNRGVRPGPEALAASLPRARRALGGHRAPTPAGVGDRSPDCGPCASARPRAPNPPCRPSGPSRPPRACVTCPRGVTQRGARREERGGGAAEVGVCGEEKDRGAAQGESPADGPAPAPPGPAPGRGRK